MSSGPHVPIGKSGSGLWKGPSRTSVHTVRTGSMVVSGVGVLGTLLGPRVVLHGTGMGSPTDSCQLEWYSLEEWDKVVVAQLWVHLLVVVVVVVVVRGARPVPARVGSVLM